MRPTPLKAPMAENVSRCEQSDLQRLAGPHRKPGDGSLIAVRGGAIIRVDMRDQVLEHDILEGAAAEATASRPRCRRGQPKHLAWRTPSP